jgi:hypothetical protein
VASPLRMTSYSPYRDSHYRAALAEGAARPAVRRADGDFEVIGTVPLVLNDDVEAAADQLRPLFASFVGQPGRNFHAQGCQHDAGARGPRSPRVR